MNEARLRLLIIVVPLVLCLIIGAAFIESFRLSGYNDTTGWTGCVGGLLGLLCGELLVYRRLTRKWDR